MREGGRERGGGEEENVKACPVQYLLSLAKVDCSSSSGGYSNNDSTWGREGGGRGGEEEGEEEGEGKEEGEEGEEEGEEKEDKSKKYDVYTSEQKYTYSTCM